MTRDMLGCRTSSFLKIIMDPIRLLEQLVGMRSDRFASSERGVIEANVCAFLQAYVAEHLPSLTIERDEVAPGRHNLFVTDGAPTRLLFLGHMDTVEEGTGWTKRPYGEREGDKLYGRGSADMKAGIVAILAALEHANERNTPGVAALFYCDEEYDFAGMKRFVKQYEGKLHPELVICPEPTQEALRPGCRGTTELAFVIRGKRGHAARPASGISAHLAFEAGLSRVRERCAAVAASALGVPTINVAALRVGALIDESTGALSTRGNVIPDFADGVLEVRTVPGITTQDVHEAFAAGVLSLGATLPSLETTADLGSFATDRTRLQKIEAAQRTVLGEIRYEDAGRGGYSDAQMIAERWGATTVIWGPAGANMHGPDEWVDLPSVERLCRAYQTLIDRA